MTEPAVDFAWGKPTPAQLLATGIRRVFCYVGPVAWGKTITQAEYGAYIGAGIEVQLVFERGADDAAGGFPAGVANAHLAEQCIPAGYPPNLPVYFAVDQSVSGAALETAVQYIAGASSVLGPNRTGDYGEGDLLAATEAAGTAKWHWQSGSTSFPGSAVVGPEVDVVQGLGGPLPSTDADTIVHDPAVAPAPAPIPPPTPQEATMLAPPTSWRSGQTDLLGTAGGRLGHWWEVTPGQWSSEDVLHAAGVTLTAGVAVPDQIPGVRVAGGAVQVGVIDSSGRAWFLAQGQQGGWGVNELPPLPATV